MLEHGHALHGNEPVRAHGVPFLDVAGGAAADLDEIVEGTVGRAHDVAKLPERALLFGANNHRAGGVAEEHAGGAVGKIGAAGKSLGRHEENDGVGMALHGVARKLQAVHETGACGVEVEAHDVAHATVGGGNAELGSNHAGRAGAEIIGGAGGHENMSDLFRKHAGLFKGRAGGFCAAVGSVDAIFENVSFLDARSGGDPFVGSFHQLFQIMIGHDAGRNAGAESTNIAGMIHEMSEHSRTRGGGRSF